MTNDARRSIDGEAQLSLQVYLDTFQCDQKKSHHSGSLYTWFREFHGDDIVSDVAIKV